MDLESGLKRQYHASLAMLKDTIEKCPESVWLREGGRPGWRIAYHTLFYTHLYLMPDEAAFVRFSGHRDEREDLWEEENPSNANPMTREEVLAYWSFVDNLVDAAVGPCNSLLARAGARGKPRGREAPPAPVFNESRLAVETLGAIWDASPCRWQGPALQTA